MSGSETPWIIVRHDSEGRLVARDDRARQLTAGERGSEVGSFVSRVAEALDAGMSLPVFTSVPDSGQLRAFLAQAGDATRVQPLRLGRANWRRRAPLALPIDIVGVGPEPAEAIERIGQSRRLQEVPVSAPDTSRTLTPRALPYALRAHAVDVVLAGTEEARTTLKEIAQLPAPQRPRLLVILADRRERRPAWLDDLEPPHGVAVAYARAASPEEGAAFAAEAMEQIADDVPVHEAVRRAAAATALTQPPEVTADPGTNEALSLDAAMLHLEDRTVSEMARLIDAGRRPQESFPRRQLRDRLFAQPFRLPELSVAAEAKRDEPEAFVSRLELLREPRPKRRRPRRPTPAIQEPQNRRVDLTVRANRRPVTTALTPNQRVRVLLRIGQPFPDSRLAEEAPPIAASLPDADDDGGHDLDVVVYGLDFRVEGRRTSHRVCLPRIGRTKLVSIPVFAPTDPKVRARLRVAIYCRAHLVQSFLLTADVAENREGEPPAFGIEFAQSARFANLDALPPRAASIAINAAPEGTHTIMLKGPGEKQQPQPVSLPDSHVTKALATFRETLEGIFDAVTDKGSSADPADPQQFAAHWRTLAQTGSDIYGEFWSCFPKDGRALLNQLREPTDQVLQLVRLVASFAYPWTMLYDWSLPTLIDGDEPPPFCFGSKPKPHQDESCGHGPQDEVFCVNGFWAVRMRLEQLVRNAGDADAPRALSGASPIRLGIGAAARDAGTAALPQTLEQLTKVASVDRFANATLEDLWDGTWRPAQIVVIGHHATKNVNGEPIGSRIQVDDTWLILAKLAQRIRHGQWDAPNTIVLLLGCATDQTTPASLNDFSFRFLEARAGAVIATEVPIMTDLAARCAERMTTSLFVDRVDFATASRELYRHLALRANPLAFSFTNLGHAELHVAP